MSEKSKSPLPAGDAEADTPASGPTRRALLRSAAVAATGGALMGVAGGAARAGEYQPAQGSMMFMKGHNMIGARTNPPGAPGDHEVPYRSFDMSFDMMEHELVPGVSLPVFAFNKQVPGPLFRVQENDWVKVNVTNNTEEMHTIH